MSTTTPPSHASSFGDLRAALHRTPADAEAAWAACVDAPPRYREEVLAPYLRATLPRCPEATHGWIWHHTADVPSLVLNAEVDERPPWGARGPFVSRVWTLGRVAVACWRVDATSLLAGWGLPIAERALACHDLHHDLITEGLALCRARQRGGEFGGARGALASERFVEHAHDHLDSHTPAPHERLEHLAIALVSKLHTPTPWDAARLSTRFAGWLHKAAADQHYWPLLRDRDGFYMGLPEGFGTMPARQRQHHLVRRVATLKARALYAAFPASAPLYHDLDAPTWLDTKERSLGGALLDAIARDHAHQFTCALRQLPRLPLSATT